MKANREMGKMPAWLPPIRLAFAPAFASWSTVTPAYFGRFASKPPLLMNSSPKTNITTADESDRTARPVTIR